MLSEVICVAARSLAFFRCVAPAAHFFVLRGDRFDSYKIKALINVELYLSAFMSFIPHKNENYKKTVIERTKYEKNNYCQSYCYFYFELYFLLTE